MAKKAKNFVELTELLSDTLDKVVNDEISFNKAKAISNLSDKVIKAQTVFLRYKQMQEDTTPIPFFDTDNK